MDVGQQRSGSKLGRLEHIGIREVIMTQTSPWAFTTIQHHSWLGRCLHCAGQESKLCRAGLGLDGLRVHGKWMTPGRKLVTSVTS